MDQNIHKETVLMTWIMIASLVLVILLQGALSFLVVKDRGQPDWDFNVVKDIPGESPYAMYPLENSQHIRGLKEENKGVQP
jgi:hypothetical protein